jgi:adenosine deaminase CECR1
MAGNPDINLFGWKQLAKWSIQHSCLSEKELHRMLLEWEKRWQDFIDAVAESSSSGTLATTEQLEKAREKAEKSRLEKLREAKNKRTAKL